MNFDIVPNGVICNLAGGIPILTDTTIKNCITCEHNIPHTPNENCGKQCHIGRIKNCKCVKTVKVIVLED